MLLVIKGIPKPKQGDKSAIMKSKAGKQYVAHYKDKVVLAEENNFRAQIVNLLPPDYTPMRGLVFIKSLVLVFPVLKGFTKKQEQAIKDGCMLFKGSTPDLDNLEKLLFDSMKGVVFLDDNQVVSKTKITKIYGYTPMTIVELIEIPVAYEYNNYKIKDLLGQQFHDIVMNGVV